MKPSKCCMIAVQRAGAQFSTSSHLKFSLDTENILNVPSVTPQVASTWEYSQNGDFSLGGDFSEIKGRYSYIFVGLAIWRSGAFNIASKVNRSRAASLYVCCVLGIGIRASSGFLFSFADALVCFRVLCSRNPVRVLGFPCIVRDRGSSIEKKAMQRLGVFVFPKGILQEINSGHTSFIFPWNNKRIRLLFWDITRTIRDSKGGLNDNAHLILSKGSSRYWRSSPFTSNQKFNEFANST